MNAAEHYMHAEKLAMQAERDLELPASESTEEFEAVRSDRIRLAQLHADLATAATLMRLTSVYSKTTGNPESTSPGLTPRGPRRL